MFPEDIEWSMDFWVIAKILKTNPSVYYHPNAYYHHDQYSNNNTLSRLNTNVAVGKISYFLRRLQSVCCFDEYKEEYSYQYSKLLDMYLVSSLSFSVLSKALTDLEQYLPKKYISRRNRILYHIRRNKQLNMFYKAFFGCYKTLIRRGISM